jgi:hypothetical protein
MDAPRTVWEVLRADGWRWVLASVLVVAPIYIWVFFYRLSSGDFNHGVDFVMRMDPVLATFVVPFTLAVRVLGWKGWKWPVMALVTGVFASMLPYNIAKQLLPGSYVTSLLVILGVTVLIKLIQPLLYSDDVPRYSHAAIVIQVLLLIVCVGLLLPITL